VTRRPDPKRRVLAVALAVLLAAPAMGSSPAAAAGCPSNGPGYQPAAGRTLTLIGQDVQSIEGYTLNTGHIPGGTMLYAAIAAPAATMGSTMQYQANRYPNSTLQIGLNMNGSGALDNINNGTYDGNITSMAQILKQAARPVYLRIGYEFDGPHNAYDPAKYILAFHHIVDILRDQGAANVAPVWHSFASPNTYQGRPIDDWYPGDAYVDWVGVSLFGQVFDTAHGFDAANTVAAFATAHTKPLMIAESTPYGWDTKTANPTSLWNAWFAPVINWSNANGVKAWSYINTNWEAGFQFPGWGDSRVENNPTLKALWLGEITKAKYLSASPTLYCNDLGYS
jgi:beta-mannanase